MFLKGRKKPNEDESSEAPSSPPQLGRSPSPPGGTRKRRRADTVPTKNRADTVDDTDEARTSPAQSPPPRPGRAGRSTNKSIGRLKGGSTSRRQSKDTTATADTADEDDGGEETEEVAEEDEQDAEGDEETASPKPSKASKAKADPPTTRKSRRKK